MNRNYSDLVYRRSIVDDSRVTWHKHYRSISLLGLLSARFGIFLHTTSAAMIELQRIPIAGG
jgi:hypothetical protein